MDQQLKFSVALHYGMQVNGQEFERPFGANTDFDREMLRNVFDSVDRNKAPNKIDKNQHEPNLVPMVVTYDSHVFVKQTYDIMLHLRYEWTWGMWQWHISFF